MYEDQIEIIKKNYDKDIKIMRTSMANEIEDTTEKFSKASRDLILLTHQYEELDKKFKLYYLKSDKYIKEREAKLSELQNECDHLAEEYGRFDQLFSEERKSNHKLKKELKLIDKEHADL